MELETMSQQLVDQKYNVRPRLVALLALGTEGTHRAGSCISKNEPKNGAVVNASAVTRYRTHGMEIEFHSLKR
jgi:hypothetical protein